MLEAIIFDMDGVIVDTEYLDFQLQSDYIRSIAVDPLFLGHEDFSELVGRSGQDLLKRIRRLTQTQVTDQDITFALEKISEKKYKAETVKDLFRQDILKINLFAKENQMKLAVASSTSKKYIIQVLEACGILKDFDLIVSGEDFQESKPNPAIYRHVLKELQLEAKNTIVIEDSPSGIMAAKAAGIRVIAFEEKRLQIDQAAADDVLEDMNAIFERIVNMAKSRQ
ncbi:HAD family hydrolase [Streptococcus porcinus]|uniref:HAD-IA family hydrolase n=1 Tax=Streptococcus porcinus TaxID=1340 RepID=A0A7V9WS43_STRPO|nr:HAD-IA family hydrolase [Streptococcus porcinus]MBA2796072.1 HAD-IA family hydrolase [Streptococcus porcinus]